MKKALHTTLKLLLVLTIFLGLQGRVLMRYAEIFNKNHKNELVHSETTKVKANIVHCKLQCYTQHFKLLSIPAKTFFSTLNEPLLVFEQVYIPLLENLNFNPPVRLLPLRAPPVF
jgi:hypothetical protein